MPILPFAGDFKRLIDNADWLYADA